MKKLFLLVLVVTAVCVSSCNRGVGCPTNFSASKNEVRK